MGRKWMLRRSMDSDKDIMYSLTGKRE